MLAGIGFAPWLGALGLIVGLVIGLKTGRTLVPMQLGGLSGVVLGVLVEWLWKRRK